MSRIQDEREAAKLAERLLIEKRQKEQKASERVRSESTFSALVQKQQKGAAKGPREPRDPKSQRGSLARDAIARTLKENEARGAGSTLADNKAELARKEGAHCANARAATAHSEEGVRTQRDIDSRSFERNPEPVPEKITFAEKAEEGALADSGAHGRKNDARTTREALDDRKEESFSRRGGVQQTGGQNDSEVRADEDRQGKGQQHNDGDQKGAGERAASFRLNPALMAPIPVANPRQSLGSERLRALAAEIAQKIVERVRVGTNAAGKAEFQIDLRSEVLAGLTVKVSASNGRISAVFSGRDRGVLKQVAEHSESLKNALKGRGLTLDELKIEERA